MAGGAGRGAAGRASALVPSAAAVLTAAALLVLAVPAAAQSPPRPAPPRLTVRILGYRFAIDLPSAGDTIAARATVVVERLRTGAADTLPLDLVGLVVSGVGGASGAPLPFAYDGRVLRVVLPPAAGPGPDTVGVTYHGRPSDGLVIRVNARGRRSFFADNWPERARHFLPVVDHPGVKAAVSWEIGAPASAEVVANGTPQDIREAPGGRRVWTYVEPHPVPTYTMVIGATDFSVSRHRASVAGSDTTWNEVWAYPEDSAFADERPFRRVAEIVDAGIRIIGPFPYRKLAHVQSATRYGGMENSSAIFYAEGGYVERRMGEGVVRHETAHQWFGDAVTPRDWRHLWLSEGFATYFGPAIAAALDGDSILREDMRVNLEYYVGSRVVDRPVVDSVARDPSGLLDANNYCKGALVLHMLRSEVGDSAFFRGVRAYYRSFRDSSVVSEDFQRVMEEEAGRGLGWFFGQWLHQPGYPRLEAELRVDSAARRATLRVRQVQPAAWGRFRLPRVEVRFLAGETPVGDGAFALEPEEAEQVFTFEMTRAPTSVRIDPEGRMLLTSTLLP